MDCALLMMWPHVWVESFIQGQRDEVNLVCMFIQGFRPGLTCIIQVINNASGFASWLKKKSFKN